MTAQGGNEMVEPRSWFRRAGRRDEQLISLRAELAVALDRAVRAERELAERAPADGAEEILRLAESQARETRSAAAREAAALLERTHAEVESHRRAVADELAKRSADAARQAADREAELDAREQEIADAAEAERREIAGLRGAAEADADRIRHAVLVAAENVRDRAVAEALAEVRRLHATEPPG